MKSNFDAIQKLLRKKADFQARLALLPYDGTPEIKENSSGKYLYMRKREAGKLRSVYVDKYSEELYAVLLRSSREARELKKNIRQVEKELALLGYKQSALSPRVELNLSFARANMKANIYDQAVLEGVTTTFPQTETILENGVVNGMTATDIQKILNLKHAWEFILDRDVVSSPSNYYVLCHIAKLVNEGFFSDGGRIRGVPVTIGGSNYVPPLPIEHDVKEKISSIVEKSSDSTETAIELCLYCMKTQIFTDGNKRAAVIFANHYLISQGGGLLVIPEKDVPDFKKLLVAYYESRDNGEIIAFMKEKCWRKF
ncbi:MAG: Fic family protein [Clostridia bacterium]|nr:Fic family protein [Clostridia bacterium]